MGKELTKEELAEIDRIRRELLKEDDKLKQLESAKASIFESEKIYHFNTPLMPANPLQAEVLSAWEDPYYKIVTFTSGNRGGKCLTREAMIDTPTRSIKLGELYDAGEQFDVIAWDEQKNRKVVARASVPFKKEGSHKCYEITMDDGTTIQAADGHLILCTDGEYRPVYALCQDAGSDEVDDLKAHALYAKNYDQTTQDSPGGYSLCRHLCGGQPLLLSAASLSFFPSLADALRRIFALSCSDGWGNKYTYTRRVSSFLHSILDAMRHLSGQFSGFLADASCNTFPQLTCAPPSFSPQATVVAHAPQSKTSCHREQTLSSSSSFSPFGKILTTNGNKVISIKPIGVKDVYDFEVEKYHNYCAAGMVHHNTFTGGVVGISTMIGKWPWNNKRLPFTHSKPRKIRWVGQDWEKHIKTVIIPAMYELWPKNREVAVKKNSLGVEAMWTDVQTGSTLEIMSNNQESKLHEGWWGDLIIYDEPPKREIRVANSRGLVDRNGRELFCMTLLGEAWVDREVIRAKNEDGTPDRTVFNVTGSSYSNVGFGITAEGLEHFKKGLTEEEIDARINGKPSYMSGLVAKNFSRKKHLKKRFKIPLDWIVDIGIDIHPRKQQAILFTATSPKQERYLCFEVWEHGDGVWVGEQIVRMVRQFNLRVGTIFCDPFAKGDSNNDNTTFDKIDMVLANNGLPPLQTGSKDKQSGVIEINQHLEGPNGEPSLFIFDDMVRTIDEIEGWMYDKETQKPQKERDDMMENLYRTLLLGTVWYPYEDEDDEEDNHKSTANQWTGY